MAWREDIADRGRHQADARTIEDECGARKPKAGNGNLGTTPREPQRCQEEIRWGTWPLVSHIPPYHLPRVCLRSPPSHCSASDQPWAQKLKTSYEDLKRGTGVGCPQLSFGDHFSSLSLQTTHSELQPKGHLFHPPPLQTNCSSSPKLDHMQDYIGRRQTLQDYPNHSPSSSSSSHSSSLSVLLSQRSLDPLADSLPSCSCCLASLRARTVGDPTSPCAFTQMGSQPVKRRRCKWSWWLLLLCSSSLLLLALVLVYLCHTTHIMEHGVPY